MPRFIRWVPTEEPLFDGFFELAPVSSSDVVYDLGSGDGRLLFAALERGAGKCIGIEIDREQIKISREKAEDRGVDGDRLTFIEGDVLEHDLSEATVVLCYLLADASLALRPKFEDELQPGTRVVMESFPVPGWKLTDSRIINGRSFYLYIMPHERTEDYFTAYTDTDWESDWSSWG